jgi:hypothetical protein
MLLPLDVSWVWVSLLSLSLILLARFIARWIKLAVIVLPDERALVLVAYRFHWPQGPIHWDGPEDYPVIQTYAIKLLPFGAPLAELGGAIAHAVMWGLDDPEMRCCEDVAVHVPHVDAGGHCRWREI